MISALVNSSNNFGALAEAAEAAHFSVPNQLATTPTLSTIGIGVGVAQVAHDAGLGVACFG